MAAGFATIVLGVVLRPDPASAHAVLVGSTPSNGAVVATAPSSARLSFSEEISPRLSWARLVDRAGRDVAGAQSTVLDDEPDTVQVSLPVLAEGSYGLLWRVFAEDDGHATSGVVVFGVGVQPTPPGIAAIEAAATSTPLDIARRWLGIVLLAGLVGPIVVALLILPRVRRARPEVESAGSAAGRRLLAVATVSAAGGVLVGAADLAAEFHRVRVGDRGGAGSSPVRPWST